METSPHPCPRVPPPPCPADCQPAQRWLKLASATDGFSSSRGGPHGGKVPSRLACQVVETVWQEYNINRADNK